MKPLKMNVVTVPRSMKCRSVMGHTLKYRSVRHRLATISLIFTVTMTVVSCGSNRTLNQSDDSRWESMPQQLADTAPNQTIDVASYRVAHSEIDSLLRSMTLREKIAQLFVVRAYGSFRNDYDPATLELKRLVSEYRIGGVLFFQGDVLSQAHLTNLLQARSPVPLWIAQDMEYGAAMRVRGTTRFTPAMGIAATGDPQNAWLKGKITAREARLLGVHQILAPVLDINNNPDNPVINVRSFGDSPETVARFGTAFIDGIQSEGLMATAKHFPGHGDTHIDSHLELPVIRHPLDRLLSFELEPFREAVERGVQSVMTAHIAYPGISTNYGRPATMDPSILNRILVDSLSFDGLIVTDGLDMNGITDHYSPGEAVVESLLAGADIMLISPDIKTAIAEVERAVLSGRISEERIDRSVLKMLTYKHQYGLFENRFVETETLTRTINTPSFQRVAERIARESVTLLRDEKGLLPIGKNQYQNVLALAVSDQKDDRSGYGMAPELRNYLHRVDFRTLDPGTDPEDVQALLDAASEADLIIIGSFVMVESHKKIQIPDELMPVLQEILEMPSPSILISFGNPYLVRELPEADVQLLAWASSRMQIDQTVPALFGASEIAGSLPTVIPDLFEVGHGLKRPHTTLRWDRPETAGMDLATLMEIDMHMQRAMDDSVFPGGVVGIVKNGMMVLNKAYGYHDYQRLKKVEPNHVYDLASVTKIMATTLAMMRLVDEGAVRLDDPVSAYLPEWALALPESAEDSEVNFSDTHSSSTAAGSSDELATMQGDLSISSNRTGSTILAESPRLAERTASDVTVRDLLLHQSGLPPFQVYVDRYKTKEEILAAVKREPLLSEPGEVYRYSDLGFMLLAEIIERQSGMPMDRYLRTHFYIPMGMNTAFFNPGKVGRWLTNVIPPTEIDLTWERGTVQGVVHDERAYFMGGVAGHAGLFGSAYDVAVFAELLLNQGVYGGKRYLSEEVVKQFTRNQSTLTRRGYGFDHKSDGFSSAGQFTSPKTFGHLGFTGTSVWIDPDEDLAVILLTNRTWPERRDGSQISRVRAAIADTVMMSLMEKVEVKY